MLMVGPFTVEIVIPTVSEQDSSSITINVYDPAARFEISKVPNPFDQEGTGLLPPAMIIPDTEPVLEVHAV
jgi:hypothetical protein